MTIERVVKLNIGGVSYCTYHDTLKCSPYFMNLLDGEMKKRTVVNGDELFIDRSGSLFEHIIDYLRTGSLESIEADERTLIKLREEAEYYQLKDLVDSIDALSENAPIIECPTSKGQQDVAVRVFIDAVGEQATLKLAFATQMRVDLYKVKIECNGQVKGLHRVEDLGKQIGWSKQQPWPLVLRQLASFMPFASLYVIEAMREKGLSVNHLKKDIESSLPVELQTAEAVALPLGPKTRRAHLKFTERRCKSYLDVDSYRSQMALSLKFKTNVHIRKILNHIERTIVLTASESEATLSPFIPELDERTIDKISDFFDLFKTK
ncbi:hypothetical protein BY458DRAFT_529798 [Sporodiniella umbellata]|nr:hypothetical protein BY458DRAFT_529798 [Sporodiniella umbellata]